MPSAQLGPTRTSQFGLNALLQVILQRFGFAGFSCALRRKGFAYLDLALLLVLAMPALLPLTAHGLYLQGSDALDPPWRAFVLREALKEGILVPRWAPDLLCSRPVTCVTVADGGRRAVA